MLLPAWELPRGPKACRSLRRHRVPGWTELAPAQCNLSTVKSINESIMTFGAELLEGPHCQGNAHSQYSSFRLSALPVIERTLHCR